MTSQHGPDPLGVLREKCIDCRACSLRIGEVVDVTPVFGAYGREPDTGGDPAAVRLIIVGEAPGPQENQTGRPFVGPAGEVLRSLLGQAGIDLSQTWITNAVACWPHAPGTGVPRRPKSVAPFEQAIGTCAALHLDHQLFAFPNARVVVALGRSAAAATVGRPSMGGATVPPALLPLLALRPGEFGPARVRPWQGRSVLVTYHPSYLAHRRYKPGDPAEAHEDAASVLRTLVAARALAWPGVAP